MKLTLDQMEKKLQTAIDLRLSLLAYLKTLDGDVIRRIQGTGGVSRHFSRKLRLFPEDISHSQLLKVVKLLKADVDFQP